MNYYDSFAASDLRKYSLLRAIKMCGEGKRVGGIEGEVSQELCKRNQTATAGFIFPLGVPTGADVDRAERRALDATAGSGAIATILDPANFIDALRAKAVVMALGATVLPGLIGNLDLPREATVAAGSWEPDSTPAPAESNPTIDNVALTPKTCTVFTDLSRKFVLQSSLGAEQFVRDDLARVLGTELDRVALNGSGASNQPLGILQSAAQINALGTNGGTPAWSDVLGLQTGVGLGDADFGALGYVTSPAGRGVLANIVKAAGQRFIWETCAVADGRSADFCGGFPGYSTTNIPANLTKGTGTNLTALVYGNWRDLVIGMWGGGVEIIVDKFVGGGSNSATGTVRIVANLSVDIAIRHVQSFHFISDILTAGQPTS
ncbi:MAG TPA: phage major capsid protein [Tepidisphaeraceae bacterium]|nr:phage major capsid protein [Tepidisphaeraceae bacterium]